MRDLLSVYCIVHNVELFTLLEEMTGFFQHLVIANNDYVFEMISLCLHYLEPL